MSTQYRKADCQSTKNVGGDKGVDPQSGPSGVSLGFKTQPEHAYLGHFKQERFLREGHNFIRRPDAVGTTLAGEIAARRGSRVGVIGADAASRGLARAAIRSGGAGAAAVAAERPVLAARMAARAAGATGAQRRALVSSARLDPNSRFMEQKTAQARRAATAGGNGGLMGGGNAAANRAAKMRRGA